MVKLTWFNHASFRLAAPGVVVYIDPWKLPPAAGDGDIVIISHIHHDHFDPAAAAARAKQDASFFGPADVIAKLGRGTVILPGQRIQEKGVGIEAVAAYNLTKSFHPKANNWIGVVLSIEGHRVYYAGDTDQTPEMNALEDIDLALLPVGGTYTLNAAEAARACKAIGPKAAIPSHWGDLVGSAADAAEFVAALEGCTAHLLKPGQSITL